MEIDFQGWKVCLAQVVGRAADGYKSFTRKMFDLIPSEKGVGGAGGKTIYDDLQSADEAWSRMKATNVGNLTCGHCEGVPLWGVLRYKFLCAF